VLAGRDAERAGIAALLEAARGSSGALLSDDTHAGEQFEQPQLRAELARLQLD
jgi:hypothetical protein